VPDTVTVDQLAQIAEIIQHLDRSPARPGANRRRQPRANVRATMSAILLSEERQSTVRIFTRNLSTSGIAFVSRRPFKPGEKFALSFAIPDAMSKLVLTNVTFVRYARGGMYEMGAEFVECVERTDASLPPRWIVPARRSHR
jgi:hypothetical protein